MDLEQSKNEKSSTLPRHVMSNQNVIKEKQTEDMISINNISSQFSSWKICYFLLSVINFY